MRNTYSIVLICFIFVLLTLIGCTSHNVASVQDYNQFAIKTAQAGLWNEAIFRWKQILTIDPDNALAYNNLGVGYEALGKIEEAQAAYQRATELEPDSKYYRINYRRCRLHIRRSGNDNTETDIESSDIHDEDTTLN